MSFAERISEQKLESSLSKYLLGKNVKIWFCLVVDVDELDHAVIVQFSGVAQSRISACVKDGAIHCKH